VHGSTASARISLVRLVRVALLLVALAVGLVSARTAQQGAAFTWAVGASGLGALLVAGFAPVVAGALHHLRHPTRWRGALLLGLVGAGWFVGEWDNPGTSSSLLFTLGLVLYAVGPAVVVHAALAYPTGRLASWRTRSAVLLGYLVTAGLQGLLVALAFDPVAEGCSCPSNLLHVGDRPALVEDVSRWVGWIGGTWSVAAVVLLLVRLAGSSPARRRSSGPVVAAAALDLGLVAVGYWRAVGVGSVADVGDRRLWLAQATALGLLGVAAVADLVREQRAHRALTRLVLDLGAGSQPGLLREAVVERIGDSDVELAYPTEGESRLVDGSGGPVHVDGRGVTELRYGGVHLASLVHAAGAAPRPEAVEELVAAAHLGLESERLQAQALAQLADLRESGARILVAGDGERRRLERDLHDGAQQRLVGLALGLQMLRHGPDKDGELAAAGSELQSAIEDLRALGRGLYPVLLHDAGLGPAVRALAETHDLRVVDLVDSRFPQSVENTAYRAVAWAAQQGTAEVTMAADGAGLWVTMLLDRRAGPPVELTDRVTTLGGTLALEDAAEGSQLTLWLPVDYP
jgi:signal transduction histidine kinase